MNTDCNSLEVSTFSETFNLSPGAYEIERRVYTNNTIPGTVTPDNSLGTPFLAGHLQHLDSTVRNQQDSLLDPLFTYLKTPVDSPDLDSFYLWLEANADTVYADSLYWLNSECCQYKIPYKACPDFDCPGNRPEFEDYFEEIFTNNILGDYDQANSSNPVNIINFTAPGHTESFSFVAAECANSSCQNGATKVELVFNIPNGQSVSWTLTDDNTLIQYGGGFYVGTGVTQENVCVPIDAHLTFTITTSINFLKETI